MSEIVIRAEGLSKQFRIGAVRQRHRTLRDSIIKTFNNGLRVFRRRAGRRGGGHAHGQDKFWALKDVSFEIRRGDVVGIIGKNGAGKSTLLKILSRITEPTSGYADVNGRVGSLLEVGTGFHPELTGRENVFLNGAILGMSRREVARKFDEILAFSEIEQFIDTPVKHYSSGMYTRLAFAVAAHLDPEILIVDEVLSVGDLAFQRKCMNKMQAIGQDGTTILLVSHNMSSIARLCQRAILLSEGKVLSDSTPTEAIGIYMKSVINASSLREWPDLRTAPGNEIVRLRRVRVRAEDGMTLDVSDIRHPVGIEIEYEVLQPGHVLIPNYHFFNEEGLYLFVLHDFDSEWRYRPRPAGRYISTAWLPGNFFSEGRLLVGVAVSSYAPFAVHFYEPEIVSFHITDDLQGDSARGDYKGHMPGVIRPIMPWTTQFEPAPTSELLSVG